MKLSASSRLPATASRGPSAGLGRWPARSTRERQHSARSGAYSHGSPQRPLEHQMLSERHAMVSSHFPTALGVDDFISRVEIALCGYGFTGDNSIGELCAARDRPLRVRRRGAAAQHGPWDQHSLGVLAAGGRPISRRQLSGWLRASASRAQLLFLPQAPRAPPPPPPPLGGRKLPTLLLPARPEPAPAAPAPQP
jgi:hypothetical protein